MTWSVSTGLTDKLGIEKAIEKLMIQTPPTPDDMLDCAVWDQLQAAKRAALELIKTVSGPNINVQLSGHANGTGGLGRAGFADDYISVTVTQQVPQKGKEAAKEAASLE